MRTDDLELAFTILPPILNVKFCICIRNIRLKSIYVLYFKNYPVSNQPNSENSPAQILYFAKY